MSELLNRIVRLVQLGEIRVSERGYDELAADGLTARELVLGIDKGRVVEVYEDYWQGPCVLLLQRDQRGLAVHALWGIPKGLSSPAVLVTAYRPDPARWQPDFIRRK